MLSDETLRRTGLRAFLGDTEPPASVIETFVRRVEAGEIESAIDLLSSEIVESVGSQRLEAILSSSSMEILLSGGIEELDVMTLAFSRDHTSMQLTIWYSDHRSERDTVDLVREGGRWKIRLEETEAALEHALSHAVGDSVVSTT